MTSIDHKFYIDDEDFYFESYAYYIGAFNYNWHNHVECLIVVNGELEASIDGNIYNLERDDICFIDSSIGHATLSKKPDTIAIVLHFDPNYINKDLKENMKISWSNVTGPIDRNSFFAKNIRRSMAMLIDSFKEDNVVGSFKRKSSCLTILYESLEHFASPKSYDEKEKSKAEHEIVNEMIVYLNENYRDRIYLSDLSKLVGYHPNYCSEIFSKIVGLPFTEYLNRYRLARATKDLKEKDKLVSDIALDHGFSNVKSFNSYFRQAFKRSPSEYRSMLDEEIREIDAEFKKVFLDDGSIYWKKARKRWLEESEDKDQSENLSRIKDEYKNQIIEEIIKNLENMK